MRFILLLVLLLATPAHAETPLPAAPASATDAKIQDSQDSQQMLDALGRQEEVSIYHMLNFWTYLPFLLIAVAAGIGGMRWRASHTMQVKYMESIVDNKLVMERQQIMVGLLTSIDKTLHEISIKMSCSSSAVPKSPDIPAST